MQVHAAGVNALDSKIRSGEFKLILPYRAPFVLGHDVAGIVVRVGADVTRFKARDEVYARLADHRIGAFAELVAGHENDLALNGKARWNQQPKAAGSHHLPPARDGLAGGRPFRCCMSSRTCVASVLTLMLIACGAAWEDPLRAESRNARLLPRCQQTQFALSQAGTAAGTAVGCSPSARIEHALAYDEARQRVVLFGGSGGGGPGFQSETWELQGETWEARAPVVSPPGRRSASVAFDPLRRKVVLFGGQGDRALLFDTWEWDGQTWIEAHPPSAPSARAGSTMAFDGHQVVLFGGVAASGRLVDTWAWDGASWRQLESLPAPPGYTDALSADAPSMALDSTRMLTVLALSGSTWEWDGLSWHPVAAAGLPDSPTLAFDTRRQRVVAFGTDAASRIPRVSAREWDGSAWRDLDVSGPVARTGHAIATSPSGAVIFGGYGLASLRGGGDDGLSPLNALFDDTWELFAGP